MKRINLLPREAQRLKDVRRTIKIMAAVQAAFFMAGVFLFFLLSSWDAALENHVSERRRVLREILYASDAMATPGANVRFWDEDFLFPETVLNIMEMPKNVLFEAIRYAGGEFFLVCRTSCISNIELHENMLLSFFPEVTLVRIVAVEGYFIYEFVVRRR